MKQLTQGWRSLRMISGCTLGLGALFLAAMLNLQGQQTGKSVLVQVDQVQGTQPVQAFVEDEFIVVLKKESRAGFRALESGSSRPQVNPPLFRISLTAMASDDSDGSFRLPGHNLLDRTGPISVATTKCVCHAEAVWKPLWRILPTIPKLNAWKKSAFIPCTSLPTTPSIPTSGITFAERHRQ